MIKIFANFVMHVRLQLCGFHRQSVAWLGSRLGAKLLLGVLRLLSQLTTMTMASRMALNALRASRTSFPSPYHSHSFFPPSVACTATSCSRSAKSLFVRCLACSDFFYYTFLLTPLPFVI